MKIKIILYYLALLSLWACNSPKPETTEASGIAVPEEDRVSVSSEEINASGLKIVKAEKRNMGNVIRANGVLDVPPQSLITISAPMGGFVKLTEVLQGMKVKRGQVIAQLEHQDYIQLQQDYLDSKIQWEFISQDYEREKELAKNNISSVRTLQEVTARYKSLQNKVNALENKLYLIGINAKELKEGGIYKAVPVLSPIDGYITKVNVNIGKYVSPNDIMFEIVDTKHLHAEITVFEKDAPFIRKDQKISYVLANETRERKASIFLLSHSISEERTLSVHAHLEDSDPGLMPGMYVTALIEVENREVYTLPQEAFVSFGDKDYVFMQVKTGKDSCEYSMVEVQKGITQHGYSEFSLPAKNLTGEEFFVSNGSFDLLAKLKNTEEE